MQQIALDLALAAPPTLRSFWPGPNADAHAHIATLAQARAAQPPVYLWGDAGSGKSHLLLASRAAWTKAGTPAGWLDATCEAPEDFDPTWGAIVLDEVEHYDAARQQVAFRWFVQAMTPRADGAPCHVLAAGSLPPADLPLREDLRTRLGWGNVFHLRPLHDTDRRAVLQQAADARGIELGDEVIGFMLRRFSRDLGSLMQLLDQLDGYALRTRRAVTVPLLREMLATT